MAAKLNENTELAMPIRNLVSLVIGTAIAVWAYFGVLENITQMNTSITMMEKEVEKNSEFRIKWPRGEIGALPADAAQFMLIEHIASELEKLTKEIETCQATFDQQQKLTLEFYATRIQQLEKQHEKIRTDMMELIHDMNGIKKNGHN